MYLTVAVLIDRSDEKVCLAVRYTKKTTKRENGPGIEVALFTKNLKLQVEFTSPQETGISLLNKYVFCRNDGKSLSGFILALRLFPLQ